MIHDDFEEHISNGKSVFIKAGGERIQVGDFVSCQIGQFKLTEQPEISYHGGKEIQTWAVQTDSGGWLPFTQILSLPH
jgi:hypothetical protein